MRSELPPARDICADLVAITTGKNDPRRRRLRRLRPHVQKRYAEYWENRKALEHLPRRKWSELASDALDHCYTGDTAARKTVLTELKNQIQPDPNLCPYCLLRQPSALDHFLPRDFYPEFSVMAWNLVYVCHPRNIKKGNRYVDMPRSIINPYFDALPGSPLLYATANITVAGVGLNFNIATIDPAVPLAVVDLASRHYVALGLEEDYRREGASVVSDLINAIAAQFVGNVSQEQLNKVLDDRMKEWSNYPINCFRLAVIDALELCPGFLGYVNERIVAAPRPVRARPRRELANLRAAAADRAAVE